MFLQNTYVASITNAGYHAHAFIIIIIIIAWLLSPARSSLIVSCPPYRHVKSYTHIHLPSLEPPSPTEHTPIAQEYFPFVEPAPEPGCPNS